MPSTRIDFWKNKFDANVARDKRNIADLTADGWQALIVWECETRSTDLKGLLADRLAQSGNTLG